MSKESYKGDQTEQKTKEKEKTKEKQETKNEKETKEKQETNKSKQNIANFEKWVKEYIKTEKKKEKLVGQLINHFKGQEKSIAEETQNNTKKDENKDSNKAQNNTEKVENKDNKEEKTKKNHRKLKKTLKKMGISLTDQNQKEIIKNHDEKELKHFNEDLNKAIKNHKFKEEFFKKREGKGFDDLLTEIKDKQTSEKDKKKSKKEKKEKEKKKSSHKHRKQSDNSTDNSSSSNEGYSKTTDDSSESSNGYSEFDEQSSDTNNSSESENNLDAYTNEHIPEEKVKEARDYISNGGTFHSPSKGTITWGRGKYKKVCSTGSFNVLWRLGLPKVSNSTECDLKGKVLPKMGLKYIGEVDPDNPEKNGYKPQNGDTAVWPRFNGTQHQATFINGHWVSDTIQRKMSCYNAKNEPMVKVYRYTGEQIT